MICRHYLAAAFNPDIVCLLRYYHKEFCFIRSFSFVSCIDYEHKVIFIPNDDLMLISRNAV